MSENSATISILLSWLLFWIILTALIRLAIGQPLSQQFISLGKELEG